MVHLSKYKLKPKFTKVLSQQLAAHIHAPSKEKTSMVIESLLTKTEQLMLAKRLAAILMIHEGYSAYKTAEILHMSSSTVRILESQYDEGEYGDIVNTVTKSKKKRKEFWDTLEIILRLGMPPMGKDRWKWLDNA